MMNYLKVFTINVEVSRLNLYVEDLMRESGDLKRRVFMFEDEISERENSYKQLQQENYKRGI